VLGAFGAARAGSSRPAGILTGRAVSRAAVPSQCGRCGGDAGDAVPDTVSPAVLGAFGAAHAGSSRPAGILTGRAVIATPAVLGAFGAARAGSSRPAGILTVRAVIAAPAVLGACGAARAGSSRPAEILVFRAVGCAGRCGDMGSDTLTSPGADTVSDTVSTRAAPDVLVLRDPRESAKRCSLTPLRGAPGVRFVAYHRERRLDAAGRVLLHPAGEPLSAADAGSGILLIDCSWRRVESLLRTVDGDPLRRRLPALVTAYPRRSRTFEDPERGLASIEALYAALAILGRPRPELLHGYRWAREFLDRNPGL